MSSASTRPFAAVSAVTEGTVLVANGDFECLTEGQECVVKRNPAGKLYVECAVGTHLLDGQLQRHPEREACYVGLYPKIDDGDK